jgi:transposase
MVNPVGIGLVNKINMDVVGLDVHKNVTFFCHMDAEGAVVHSGYIKTEEEEVLRTIGMVTQGRPVHVALEASGGMFWLYDVLVEVYGASRVHVAHPRHVRAIANSRQKNDRNDACWLAYLTFEGRLPEAWIPTGVHRELRTAVRSRIEAVRMRTRTVVQIRSHLRQLGMILPGRRFDGEESLERVRAKAAVTQGTIGTALRLALGRYDALQQEIRQWDTVIKEMTKEMPEHAEIKRKIPGVGDGLAAVIVAESGPMQRFRSPHAYARYTGLTPSDRSTGGRTIHGAITREGSKYLRWALGQAVMGCLRNRKEITPARAVARWVERKERRTGSRAKVRVAAARKLATAIWWLFHRPESFDAFKPFGAVPQLQTA